MNEHENKNDNKIEKIEIITGVAAEYNGKFWGIQYDDGNITHKDFGPLDKADISDPKYCSKPTDLTHNPASTLGRNPDYKKLEKAKLVGIKKTITTEIEFYKHIKK